MASDRGRGLYCDLVGGIPFDAQAVAAEGPDRDGAHEQDRTPDLDRDGSYRARFACLLDDAMRSVVALTGELSVPQRDNARRGIVNLQAAVEFGWLGSSLLLLPNVLAGGSILVPAMGDGASRFVLCSFNFVVLMSFAHGRISRDTVLFAFLGCAVGLKESKRLAGLSGDGYRHGKGKSQPRTFTPVKPSSAMLGDANQIGDCSLTNCAQQLFLRQNDPAAARDVADRCILWLLF
jgi:hypothetical protein